MNIPKIWWDEMKRLRLAKAKNGDLCSLINADHFSDLSQVEQANLVN